MTQPSKPLPDYVIERYCQCFTYQLHDACGQPTETWVTDRSACPLHSSDPMYDLPEGVM